MDEQRLTFGYDVTGNKILEIEENKVNGSWQKSKKRSFSYNLNGKLLTSYYYEWRNGSWEKQSRLIYTYNPMDSITSFKWEEWANNQWVLEAQQKYSYDVKGRLTYEERINSGGKNRYFSSFQYNENGKLIKAKSTGFDYGNINTYTTIYKYDNSGNLIEEVSTPDRIVVYEDAQYRYLFTYDKRGRKLTERKEFYYDNWKLAFQNSYSYDENSGLLITEIHEPGEINEYEVNKKRVSYMYDRDGRILSSLTEEQPPGQAWSKTISIEYAYDRCGNLINETNTYHGQNANYSRNQRKLLKFDDSDNTSSVEIQEQINDKWVAIKRVIYGYDELGNMTSALNQECEEGKWKSGQFGEQVTVYFNSRRDSITLSRVSKLSVEYIKK